MRGEVSLFRLKAAWVVAVGTDALQMFFFPATVEGVFSPVTVALDCLAMVLLAWLVGWHWVFLPSIVFELIPGVELAPTWTIAMAIVSRGLNTRAQPGGSPEGTPPKDVTPHDDAHTITVEAKSSPSTDTPGKQG